MLGRPTLPSMYKRMTSKDYSSVVDTDLEDSALLDDTEPETSNLSWKPSLIHVLVATISSFLFGYHLGVVNETLESISVDLGFNGNTLAEGLVVSTCLGGAFVGCLFSGWVADGVGRRRAFQLSALPMIIGASISATTKTLEGMLLGRLLVGTGMGLGPPVAALYVTEVSPPFVRGTFGRLHSDCNLSWTHGCSVYWNSKQGKCGLVAGVFLGICHTCYSSRFCHGVLCRKSSLVIQARKIC